MDFDSFAMHPLTYVCSCCPPPRLLPLHLPLQPAHEKTFFGDNFVRTSGEYAAWQALNLHSMTAAEKGGTVHVQVRGQGRMA
jgi:hypothetical protein